MSGKLFIVATPIGNLEDLTPRARKTLAEVDLIAAEDTRHTGRLLSHIGVNTRLLALHDHNEEKAISGVIAALQSGQSVALVSDAGTPLLSDPGYRLVRAAHQSGIKVSPVPGVSAVTAALSVAGLPTDRFCFEGFLPAKKAARCKALESLASETRTLVFFESVHRIAEALDDMCDAFGDERPAFIGRELTKMYEQCTQQTLRSLRDNVGNESIVGKGEFVIVVAGSDAVSESSLEVDRLLLELGKRLPANEAAKVSASVTGLKKNDLYQRILELKDRK
ncbi:MAG: 16S rRNA (cytidine(1402)-2'-O)-methyltransferase [Gammaproteobacteria bacterium]|nr:16S rRNA (cytidine(1402)-2'-O)-methyltransferase [Gammaproteobacteria bacterium]